MKPSDVFGICVRVIGLLGLLTGSGYVIGGICFALWGKVEYEGFRTGQYLFYGVVFCAIGLYFMRGAPHFIRFAYPDEKVRNSNNTPDGIRQPVDGSPKPLV